MTFYLTFGYGQHEGRLRDNYVAIHASDYTGARAKVEEWFGQGWSQLYTEKDFTPSYYPKGEISLVNARILAEDPKKYIP